MMNRISPNIVLKSIVLIGLLHLFFAGQAQVQEQRDQDFIRQLFDESLSQGRAYEDLRSLCKDVGARLSGSAEAEMAVKWGQQRLESYGFDTVYLQEIMVPHWERGTKESGWIEWGSGEMEKCEVLALGGSVSTEGLISAELIGFERLEELKDAPKSEVEGKIVFVNQPMDEKMINTFSAYGGCYPLRSSAAVHASKLGAKAVIIRSLSLLNHDHPHTGTLSYEEGVKQIPAAAISTNSSDYLHELLQEYQSVKFYMEMNCQTHPEKKSHNVIAEMHGTERPDHIISFGGHLDSWDVGEGAHDDGAGIVHSMEALRLLNVLGYEPKNTLRVVFFMNEENGNNGGKTYAQKVKEKGEIHIAAVESDRGGFSPRGFSCDGNEAQLELLQSFLPLFKPYELHKFEKGYGGVDISPLKEYYEEIPLFGFIPDSQRYFDYHHNANDVFEEVNKRELELGAASMASLLYLLDQYLP